MMRHLVKHPSSHSHWEKPTGVEGAQLLLLDQPSQGKNEKETM